MGLAGFDFEALNRQWLAATEHPVNTAERYGATSIRCADGVRAWRCIGIYHLSPDQNKGRHNLFVDVLDESGKRIPGAIVLWRWSDGAPTQQRVIDKPDSEPGCDIDMSKGGTYNAWLGIDGLESDIVAGIHTRHDDEPGPNGEIWNSQGHHSFYVCFQRRTSTAARPPVLPDPPVVPPTDNAAILAQLDVVQAELSKLRGML